MKHQLLLLILILGGSIPGSEPLPGQTSLAGLTTPQACQTALKQSDPVLRRAAFNRLLDFPGTRVSTIQNGLGNSDPVIRYRALLEYFQEQKDLALPQLRRMATDPDPQVQILLIECAKRLTSKKDSKALIAAVGNASSDISIKRIANRLTSTFDFYRKKQRLSENPDFDYNIQTLKSLSLPRENWKFQTDSQETGHAANFFAEKFDDSKWPAIKQGVWEHQGFPDYDGVAWYRIRFIMPPSVVCNATELLFQAIDEEAWVWLNGVYIGQHAEGPNGWNTPFYLDVTQELRWGQENILVVRVRDSSGIGGIYKPISVEILK